MTAAVFLRELGIVCALGSGPDAVRAALLDAASPGSLSLREGFGSERALAVGAVNAVLPTVDDQPLPLRSRNNMMLRAAFDQIAGAVEAAIARHGPERVAVVVGTSTSGIGEAELALPARRAQGAWPAGFHYGQQEIGAPSRFLAALAGTAGPAWTLSTACSSSAKALASAARLLRAGIADAVIAGGADTLCRFTVAGFSALESVSATRCNPFSRNRDGINLGEGAALFLLDRQTGPVRLSGWGETSDAFHASAPDPSGAGAMEAMRQALARAGLAPDDVGYINLHGTATRQNDAMESRAVAAVLGPQVPASSTKPLTGHTLGAAGAIEAGLCWLAMTSEPRHRLPPHWWDGEADPELVPLALVRPGQCAAAPLRHAMSTSFAFGGSNVALAFSAG